MDRKHKEVDRENHFHFLFICTDLIFLFLKFARII